MSEISKILDIADAEVGYLEKSRAAYNANPDIIYDKTAGAGNDNITKYAKEMDDLQVYNSPKQGYAWCKVFVDWCMMQALGLDRAGQLLYGWTAGVTQEYNWFKANGRISSTPQIGDLIIFGDCDHIGFVENVDGSRVYTIEGNTSGSSGLVANGGGVAKKSYSRTSSYIKCYCRPDYEGEPVPPTPPTPPQPSGDKQIREIQEWCNSYDCNNIAVDGEYGQQTKAAIIKVYQTELNRQFGAGLVVDGYMGSRTKAASPIVRYGAEGNITKSIQSMLYCRGYNTNGVDGLYYDGTERAVRTFQANQGISADGIFGPETAYRLFNNY